MIRMNFLGAVAAAILTIGLPAAADAAQFDFKNTFHAYMKLDRFFDYENSVDDYMQTFRPSVWKNRDVLVMQEKRDETLKMMKDAAASYDLNDPFDIVTDAQLGEYDVTTEKFGFQPYDKSTYFSVSGSFGPSASSIKVMILNPEFISGMPLPKDKAKAFLDSRKNGYGIDRAVKLQLKVKPTKLMSEWMLGGEIVGVEVIDPKQQVTLWRKP